MSVLVTHSSPQTNTKNTSMVLHVDTHYKIPLSHQDYNCNPVVYLLYLFSDFLALECKDSFCSCAEDDRRSVNTDARCECVAPTSCTSETSASFQAQLKCILPQTRHTRFHRKKNLYSFMSDQETCHQRGSEQCKFSQILKPFRFSGLLMDDCSDTLFLERHRLWMEIQ